MKARYHKNFKKHFKLRIETDPSLDKKFRQWLELFLKNPMDQILKDHPLKGDKSGFRSFSISGDIRVVYKKVKVDEEEIELYDIGSHNQVY